MRWTKAKDAAGAVTTDPAKSNNIMVRPPLSYTTAYLQTHRQFRV